MNFALPDINALSLDQVFQALNPAPALQALFELARDEDLGKAGDITTQSLMLHDERVQASVVARTTGTICGWRAVPHLVEAYASVCTIEPLVADGGEIDAAATAGTVRGPEADLLSLERPLLNLLSHLSGIATLTQQFVRAVSGTNARVFDTRKTTPGWRGLEKYAVRCGGGHCHRLGLYDAILVKDNHLAAVNPRELTRWLSERLAQARDRFALRFVEVEVDSPEQLRAVLDCPRGIVDVILLDNMTAPQMREAVKARDDLNPQVELEASGGVRLDTIASIAATGVDRIAVGALTHSAAHLDLGLDMQS